jgi:hypothetical protein
MSKLYYWQAGFWKKKGRPDLGAPVPRRPLALSVTGITTTAYTLDWQAATVPNASYPVTDYKIYTTDAPTTTVSSVGNVVTSNRTGSSGALYTIRISAVNSIGEGPLSDPLTVQMSESPPSGSAPGAPQNLSGSMTSSTSSSISWEAPLSGGSVEEYRIFRGGTFLVGTVSSSTFTFSETGTPVQTLNYTVRGYNAANGLGAASNTLSLTYQPPPTGTTLHAGHTPWKVMWGSAGLSSGNARPLWNSNPDGNGSIVSILGINNIDTHRYFDSGWISASKLNGWLADADSLSTANHTMLAWCSFKASSIQGNGSWARVSAGLHDAELDLVKNIAIQRRNQGKRPFMFAIEHEPENNNGSTGGVCNTASRRAEWATMQAYLSDYFASVNDIMAFSTIANGQWWKNSGVSSEANSYYPQSLINKLKNNKHLMAVDQYDAIPGGGIGTKTSGYTWDRAVNGRIENMVAQYISWCRSKGSGAIGWGEIGTTVSTANHPASAQGPAGGATSPGPLTAAWNIIRENRDIVTVVNYFNSNANSRWDWRLIPSSYPKFGSSPRLTEYWPGDNFIPAGVSGTGSDEIGGNAQTQARMNEYLAISLAARTAPYNQQP